MNIGEICATAGIYTVLGMGTVFCILILISIIIWLLGVLTGGARAGQQKPEEVHAPAPVKAVPAAAAAGVGPTDDAQIAAVIMAAIAASRAAAGEEELDDDAYVVRSIRRATWKYTQSE